MDEQFNYIIDLAKQYKVYADQPDELYKAINKLPKQVLEEIFQEYGDPENKFQPVNLLRAESARQLLNDVKLSGPLVEEIKEKIRTKEINYFNHLPQTFLEELKNYPIGKRDIFANWQKPWSIFHTFFYRTKWGNNKGTVQNYLEQLSKDLIQKLDLKNYTSHSVDFQGASNFGSDWCWIALYPISKYSHRDAYQFFVLLSANPEAGRMSGYSVKDAQNDKLVKVNSYTNVLKALQDQKDEIVKLNNESRNYFKFAPGSQASEWSRFYQEGIAAVDYSNLNVADISEFSSREQINVAAGLDKDSESNQTWNLWLFKTANIGDVLFASKGVNTCIGIGIIDGEYYYDTQTSEYKNRRKVKWLTDKVYQYKGDTIKGYKTLFRPDTFSPTKVWEFLLNEYVRLYPELIALFDEHKLKFNKATTKPIVPELEEGNDEDEEVSTSLNFWWLNANPKIWRISEYNEGDRQTYTTHNEKGNKRRIYKYFEEVKKGDLIIGYESTPTKQIKAIYEITKGIHITKNGEEIEFELVEKLEIPVHWNELKNNPALEKCEVFNNNQGSLFRLTEEEYDIIRDTIDNKNIISEKLLQSSTFKLYDFASDPDKPFISKVDFKRNVDLLKRKKNIILQGPPGVGKTFLARKLAYELLKEMKDAQIEMVQFHQSYSYEDFVQGIRPNTKGGFDIREGIFFSFCKTALANPGKDYFFIIDEINRGNLSKIFGELLMLIETDKRNVKYALKLTYAEDEEDRFYIPENLYIIGTMNTADRSLAIVDYALRRRFAFITLQPEYGPDFCNFLNSQGLSNEIIDHICSAITKVNDKIKEDINLGDGFQIGHSYFCTYNNDKNENLWWDEVLQFEIKPLLEEIWFDDKSKVTEVIKLLNR